MRPARRPRIGFKGLLLLLPLLLGGCSGTPFGETLSRSFPGGAAPADTGTASPPKEPAGTAPGPGNSAPTGTAAGAPVPGKLPAGQPVPLQPAAGPASSGPTATGAMTANGTTTPTRPGGTPPAATTPGTAVATVQGRPPRPASSPAASAAPYRVTIRLPQADPSAPAEVVTEALRAAGVPFEVETIERMAGSGSTAPSPHAPAAAAPVVRPAPPPR
jgi:hypothetical protein